MRRRRIPVCPDHPGSKVWSDGTYAVAGGRRRRYRCIPAGPERPHRFTDPLREEPGLAAAPRRFSYTAREIASALVDVGGGLSYRAAARRVRAQRGARPSPDGNTVADWVELFAPSIFERYATARWPATVQLGRLAFRARGLGSIPESSSAVFELLGALTPLPDGRSELVALEAFPASPARAGLWWEQFLRSLPGTPERIVCAPGLALAGPIRAVWPPAGGPVPVVFLCERRLAADLLELLRVEGVPAGHRLHRSAARAFDGPAPWRAFTSQPHPRRLRRLEAWLARYGERIAWQLAQRGSEVRSVELLDEQLAVLSERLAGRRGNLANRERTNRLLKLLQLDLTGKADAARYAAIVKEELAARGGSAGVRRTITDRDGASLRF